MTDLRQPSPNRDVPWDYATEEEYRKGGWRCFHCDERFDTPGGAADHFGSYEGATPGCILKVQLGDERGLLMELRKREAELNTLRSDLENETTSTRVFYAQLESHLQSYKQFRNCRSIQDVFNVYDSKEGEWLVGQERIAALEAQLSERDAKIAGNDAYVQALNEARNDKYEQLRAEFERQLAERDRRIGDLESTIGAWGHAEIIKCGCRYNRVWGGMKWEHWLVMCAEHRSELAASQAAYANLRDAVQFVICACGDELSKHEMCHLCGLCQTGCCMCSERLLASQAREVKLREALAIIAADVNWDYVHNAAYELALKGELHA